MQPSEGMAAIGACLPPTERCLQALAVADDFPDVAIAACVVKADETAPLLRATLEKAGSGALLTEEEMTLVFRGLYVLGGVRDTQSFQPLLRLLRRPPHEVEEILGDAITEGLPRIAAGLFDGDSAALFSAIADPSIDEFVRGSLLGAATFRAWDGGIARDDMRAFLLEFDTSRLVADEDETWVRWVDAIALLGFRDMEPLARAAFDDGRISPMVMDVRDFDRMLQETEQAPDDVGRFKRWHLGYIDDVIEALDWTRPREQAKHEDDLGLSLSRQPLIGTPFVNHFRHVGRNDPCPCGSGKKFKKCCREDLG